MEVDASIEFGDGFTEGTAFLPADRLDVLLATRPSALIDIAEVWRLPLAVTEAPALWWSIESSSARWRLAQTLDGADLAIQGARVYALDGSTSWAIETCSWDVDGTYGSVPMWFLPNEGPGGRYLALDGFYDSEGEAIHCGSGRLGSSLSIPLPIQLDDDAPLEALFAMPIRMAARDDDGRVLWNRASPDYTWWMESSAVGDLDGDGRSEVITSVPAKPLTALSPTGEVLWLAPQAPWGGVGSGAPYIHDFFADGYPEVVVAVLGGLVVLDGGTGRELARVSREWVGLFVVADTDGDGVASIIANTDQGLEILDAGLSPNAGGTAPRGGRASGLVDFDEFDDAVILRGTPSTSRGRPPGRNVRIVAGVWIDDCVGGMRLALAIEMLGFERSSTPELPLEIRWFDGIWLNLEGPNQRAPEVGGALWSEEVAAAGGVQQIVIAPRVPYGESWLGAVRWLTVGLRDGEALYDECSWQDNWAILNPAP